MSPNRKRVFLILGLVLLIGLGFMIWPFVVGGSQMERFCQSLAAGSSPEQVQQQVSGRGYRMTVVHEGHALIHDSRSFGRYICEVHFESSGLVSSTYSFND